MIDKLKEKPWMWRLPFLVLLILFSVFAIRRHQGVTPITKAQWQHSEGAVFGTFYHLTYEHPTILQTDIDQALEMVNNTLSMFNPKSTLSKVNSNEDLHSDAMLESVFALAQKVSRATDGAFDVTVAPLVNAWGFGFKNGAMPDSATVDSLRALVGWNRVSIEGGMVKKEVPGMVLDFSAIAKGYGCDAVASVLRHHGVRNFMVEIGGEVVVDGMNDKGKAWRIGVNKPIDDSLCVNNELETVLELSGKAMATSGNYRNFYVTEDGRKVAHTIDPHTGYPVQHSILSATVVAPTCAEADAFATSFMVMGLEKAKEVLKQQKQLQVFLIYAEGDENKVYSTVNEAK